MTLEGQLKLWHTAAQTVAHPCLGVGLAEAKGGLFTARKAARNGREKSTRLGAPLPACAPAVSTRRLRFDSSSLKIGTVQHKCGMRRTLVRAFAPREQQALPSQKRKPDTPKTLTPRKTSFVYKRLLSLSLSKVSDVHKYMQRQQQQANQLQKEFLPHTSHTRHTQHATHTKHTHTHTHTHLDSRWRVLIFRAQLVSLGLDKVLHEYVSARNALGFPLVSKTLQGST